MTKNTKENLLSLTPEKLRKRRKAVDALIRTYTIDGITLHPDTLEILEGYAKGNYSLEEFNILMDRATL
ncbi:antitoxin VbhA family protein [Bartonella sp. CB189]|uniref:antitoxin VbhA family protein n=1 Tax=Bartonella sp. CB189 TaxID=3112254 RepID=UPI002F96569E